MQRRAGQADARVSQLIARHERSLMRVAQHWSLCRDDALDAYQRALEIYLRRVESLDPATEIAWMKVVVKNEALAVRRARTQLVPVEEVDVDGSAAEAQQRPVDEQITARERVGRSAEALRRIKPDEARALMLKAQGLSYAEIGETLGWSYTKVNRCLTEGRARFLRVYAQIEAGEECERFAPTLAALVGGTATAGALLELRPHIRNCASCRATVRELHATRLGRLTALFPVPLLIAPLRWVSGRVGETAEPEAILLPPGEEEVPQLSPLDGITDLDELAAPLEFPEQPGRLLELKMQAYQWLNRLSGTDVATSAQIAAGTGGGRIATIGAVIGLCLSGLGAGTACVVTGVVENPFAGEPPRAVVREAERTPAREPRRRLRPRPAATAEPARPRSAEKPQRESTQRSHREPAGSASHEQPAPAPAPAGATQDFSFEQAVPAAPAAPAAAPSNGGGEFAP
jgi:RNA polymerase sigma factor (sigma-70 family)